MRGAASLAVTTAVIATVVAAHARGPIGRNGGASDAECEAARCEVAASLAESCPCEDAGSRREHVRCVARAAKKLAVAKALPTKCRRTIVRCAQKSSCGRSRSGTCWVIRAGVERCSIRPPARCRGTVSVGSCCGPCGVSNTTLPPGGTTTTTSSSTTTTLLPCAGAYPVCLGSCPAGSTCTGDGLLGGCFCAPSES
jgi:hypothetical protein